MEKKTQIKLSTRLLLLLALMGTGLIVASVLSLLPLLTGKSMLWVIALQDVLAFIVPALVAMAIFYRKPLNAMGLGQAPDGLSICVIVTFYIVSLPAMNWLVAANEAMTLPSWMSGIEQWMRVSEDAATTATRQLLDIDSFGQLLPTVFVVGFMAGLSEEMLFRGAMLRTMQDSRIGTHAVVWIVAMVFSAFHLQFYGFIPRMVLGLWLGYLLVWTRSLWVPVIAHTLNNSTVVISSYLANKGIIPEGYGDNLGLPADGSLPWLPLLSLLTSLGLAIWVHKHYTARQSD